MILNLRCQAGLMVVLFSAVPSLVFAQRAPRMVGAPAPARGRTTAPASIVGRGGANRGNGNRTGSSPATRNPSNGLGLSGSPLSIEDLLNPFPGFGFDFEHLSAINQNLAIKALIDPATQARLAIAERVARNTRFAPGYFLLDGGGSYAVPVGEDQQPQAQQPIIIVQQPAPAQVAEQAPADYAPMETPTPLPDEGEFTLVLRNGKQLQAAAFTRMSDKIVYITPDGGRRTVALGDLDSGETQRVNQERGVPLQLSL